jgi:ethanolamine permease
MADQQSTRPARRTSVTYREADENYFTKRTLRRHAGVWSLWALGVAAVISGDFFGWNFGLEFGFGGLLVATLFITVMYLGLCYSIAEMSPALPHTGGAYSFGRSAMGPWGGFITGVAESIEYVVTPAVIVVGIGGYMDSIAQDLLGLSLPLPVWWLIFYAIFVGLNIVGVEASFRFSVVICIIALTILVVFWIGALTKLDFQAQAIDTLGGWFPEGVGGIFFAIPFAIWFFLAIEELPLAAEESHDPRRDIPRGTIYGLFTLIVAAFLTLFLSAGIAPGSKEVAASAEPLFLGFQTIFGSGTAAALLSLIAVTGLVASFHTIIFAYGRNIYSLSRAGYFPSGLSITNDTRQTPHVALLFGAIIGFVLALILQYSGSESVGAALLTMAVFGAVISYIMQMVSFVLLRRNKPNIERPYRSKLGVGGAVVAGVIATVSLISLFFNADYRPGVVGTAIWFVAAIAYFAIAGRHKLVLSPEEEFATTGGQRGAHLESEGYGTTHVSDINPTATHGGDGHGGGGTGTGRDG